MIGIAGLVAAPAWLCRAGRPIKRRVIERLHSLLVLQDGAGDRACSGGAGIVAAGAISSRCPRLLR